MTPTATAVRHRWLWLAVATLLLVEFFAFERLAARRQAQVYPRWSDQIQYLTESYQSYDELKAHGWARGLAYAFNNPAAQGTLHDVVAVVAFGLFGASRTTALDLNMAVFLAWQAATFFAVLRLTGSRALAWTGFGLLLCLAGPWTGDAGSAVDFRLDHAAMCLWGITGAAALLTRGFRELRWSLAFGVLTGLTIVERFLTGAYFAPVFLGAAAWILCGDRKLPRLRNLALAGLVAFVIAAPFFWMHRSWIINYYWQGHFANAESAARAPGLGFWGSVRYILDGFWARHLGWVFGGFVLVLTVPPLLLESFWDRMRALRPAVDRDWLFAAAAFLLVPTAILCLHRQKSEYVLGILAPGLVMLLLLLWHLMFPALGSLVARLGPRLQVVIASAALLLGFGYFVSRQMAPVGDAALLADSGKVRELVERLHRFSKNSGTPSPSIGVDQVRDGLDGWVMRVINYERHHEWMTIHTQLPAGILPMEEPLIFERLAACDFVFLTDMQHGDGYWPYDHQMRRLYPRLKGWCDEHLDKVESFPIFEREMSLYQRRANP